MAFVFVVYDRLCSIECNFAAPLTDPTNAPFQKDMNAWAAISNRTYIWDYVTNFAAYVQPFPNYYVLGPNIRYYLAHGTTTTSYCVLTSTPLWRSNPSDMLAKAYITSRMCCCVKTKHRRPWNVRGGQRPRAWQ
jgi:uncharacterized membrane protein